MSSEFKYEVAFSFLEKDEQIAAKINHLVEGRCSTFFYSKQQKEIAGKDGETTFNKVFSQEARLVVVLYDLEWGTTPWTRIEETAIRDRAYSNGYDFVVFVMVAQGLKSPKWLPRNRIWVGLDRYGIEGAAAVIEARIQELDGHVHDLSAADKVKQKAQEIEFEQSRQEFLCSGQGVEAAKAEVESLFSGVKTIVPQISSKNMNFRIDEDARHLVVFSSGYTLSLLWSVQWENSLEHAVLKMRIFRGSIPFKNRAPFEDPQRLTAESYYFDRTIYGNYGWRLDKQEENILTTEQVVERCMTKFIDRIKVGKFEVKG